MTTQHPPVDISPAAHYDRVTDAWALLLGDDLHYGVFDEAHEPLPSATQRLTMLMAAAAEFRSGDRFLDVGCGVGTSTRWAVRQHGLVGVGISTSAHGVTRARAKAAAAGLSESLTFEIRDGMHNEFADESFDRVWALESSHLMRDRAGLLRECGRVLRRAGRFTLCDIMLVQPVTFQLVRSLRAEFGLLSRVFGDARMETLDTYAELAAAAGLEVDLRRDLSAQVRPTFSRWRANGLAHRAEVSALIGQGSWQEFVDSCGVLEQMWDQGILGYGMLSATKN
ncbi:demethylrebeccamycin-D-glucose O-methyltransferase [Rhodococcus sp. MTM3W5.2]|uniref:SAM-dependent methyltransferase n=1 Tax=Rhodococcus sp. MTM3W5.2 TaxID=1805827 RepID=UPI0009793655|nr:class I SAM-dependent methyltransferase [Rhodococcus sp. MTM3W5.2]AQA21782.1 demethylrebeccamycin-D-glucose O-methyltransferase [Rhodococcus sp. MTM3W5.2]